MDSYFTDDQTLTLLKLVHTKDMQDKFNSNKKKHRKVWEEIAQILESQGIKKSAAKCQNRYENTKRSYNTIKRNHTGSEKPNYAYWDFWESILGEKKEFPFEGFEEFHDTYLRLKKSRTSADEPIDWEYWSKYESYYKHREQTIGGGKIHNDNVKHAQTASIFAKPIFTDRETDELLLIMGEPATRQIFIKHRKKHRIAWNYILKRLKDKGIHKTADKVKNSKNFQQELSHINVLTVNKRRLMLTFDEALKAQKSKFENLKRKYMHHKKNLKSTNDPPAWRYWNVFEEYMASRPNPKESDFMTDDPQEHETVELEEEDCEEPESDVNETDFEDTGNKSAMNSIQEDELHLKIDENSQISNNPIDEANRLDENFCRICLQSEHHKGSENMVNLFSSLNENNIEKIRINEALAVCVGLEIFQDLPNTNQICMDCINQLRATYNFRKLCWASEYELKSNGFEFQSMGRKSDEQITDNRRVLRQRPGRRIIKQECPGYANNFFSESGVQDEPPSISHFETIYEFVDANPKENDESDKTEGMVTEENDGDETTSYIEDQEQKDHRKTDHGGKLTSFKCSICMKKFPNIEYIKKHLVKIHSLISESQTFKNYLELSNCDSDDELDDNVKCYICGKSYVKREYLKKHLKLIHNITDADYNVYKRIDDENKTKKPLLCHSCGESFVLKHLFKKHIEHHERGSLLSCDYCDIKLVDKPALQRHMILHTGQRNHKCIFCAKGFFTRISQKRHERNVHTKEKSHICQYCNKKFVMWKFLERHLNTHTAEVVYECDQCDKKYLNKNHLRVHKFRHAKEPPFKCSICSKAYFDRSTLKKHNYVHTGNPYQCSRCDRSFDRRDKMNNHLQKVHAAENVN